MHQYHKVFETPANPNQIIWRYQELAKLLDLLQTSELYFCRADLLGDPFEGSVSKKTLENRKAIANSFASEAAPDTENLPEQLARHLLQARQETYVNCWHMNHVESAAMWAQYGRNDNAIAIQSTFHRLVDSMESERTNVFVGEVKYVDYDLTAIPEDNTFYPFLHKRLSFKHENELRAIVWLTLDEKNKRGILPSLQPPGFRAKVDLETLVERIYVSPLAPSWYTRIIRRIAADSNLKKRVVQSRLGEEPIF